MAADPTAEWRGEAMGTVVHLVVDAASRQLLAEAIERIRDWDVRWSRFRDDSEIAAINSAEGRPVVVSPDTARLIGLAVHAWHLTGGRFDPTIHDALVAAGYGRPFRHGPTPIGPSVRPPGVTGIDVDADAGIVMLPRGVAIDLGGIAKGHAADLLVRDLCAAGARGAAATLGGDAAVAGQCPFADGWPITADGMGPTAVAHLGQGGFCYSTTQHRRWPSGTSFAHHIIDPATGTAADSSIVVAAIAASRAATAEVFATASIVAGWPMAAEMVESVGLSGFVITEHGDRHELGRLGPNPPEPRTAADGRGRE